MVIQDYTQTSNTEEGEVEWFYEDLQDLLELIPQKDVNKHPEKQANLALEYRMK